MISGENHCSYFRFNTEGDEELNFIVSATTDVGLIKSTNQDSYSVKVFSTQQGKMVLAVLCDGMGGLAKGEVASASVVHAFNKWAEMRLPALSRKPISDEDIRKEWTEIATQCNEKIKAYGAQCGVSMGTTVTAMLLTGTRYYVMNIGDTRAYEITTGIKVITKDHTLVAREVEMGRLTPEQAKRDSRRSVLLQCIGASEIVVPDLFFGEIKENATYMLCSDGFRHEITENEIFAYLNPAQMVDTNRMKQNMDALIEINKQRQERDNISVITVRTF